MSPEDIPFLNLPAPKVVLSYETDNDNDETDNDESSEGPPSASVNSAADGESRRRTPSTAVNAAADRKVDCRRRESPRRSPSAAVNTDGKADRGPPPPQLTLPGGLPKKNTRKRTPSRPDYATFDDAPARRARRQAREVIFAGAVEPFYPGAVAPFFLGVVAPFFRAPLRPFFWAPLRMRLFLCAFAHETFSWAPLHYLFPCSFSYSVITLYFGWKLFYLGDRNRGLLIRDSKAARAFEAKRQRPWQLTFA